MSRTWSVDELITDLEACGVIAPPLTPDERALARAAAAAQYFATHLTELPGRCHDRGPENIAMGLGILTVAQHVGKYCRQGEAR
jgi:hypothetical protein